MYSGPATARSSSLPPPTLPVLPKFAVQEFRVREFRVREFRVQALACPLPKVRIPAPLTTPLLTFNVQPSTFNPVGLSSPPPRQAPQRSNSRAMSFPASSVPVKSTVSIPPLLDSPAKS